MHIFDFRNSFLLCDEEEQEVYRIQAYDVEAYHQAGYPVWSRNDLASFEVFAFIKDYLMHVPHYAVQFETPENAYEMNIDITDSWITIRNFPLPEKYTEKFFDIILPLNQLDDGDTLDEMSEYPFLPPVGFYVPTTCMKEIEEMQKKASVGILNYGIANGAYGAKIHSFNNDHYRWMCFKYRNMDWQYNLLEPEKGDNLTKYLLSLYQMLSGKRWQ